MHSQDTKIAVCNGIDPDVLIKKDFSYKLENCPSAEFPRISNDLPLQTLFDQAQKKEHEEAWKNQRRVQLFF